MAWTTRGRRRLLLGIAAGAVACSALGHALPSRYDPSLFTPERGFPEPPQRLGDGPGGSVVILVPVEGAMAFTTPSNYLGLYDSGGALEAEVRLGAFPAELVSWDREAIVLRVHVLGLSGPDTEYVRAAAGRATRLGPYRLRVLVE